MSIVDDLPAAPPRRYYPWAEWFDGQPREARRGVDFDVAPLSFRQMVFTAAKRRGLQAKIVMRGDTVYFQAPVSSEEQV